MANINNFEELKSWQKSRELCAYVFELTNKESFKREFSLKDQIKRSSGSVMDNIAEGFDRDGNNEFRQFLSIAKASCAETRSQLIRTYDREYINKELFKELYEKNVILAKKLTSFINYLNKSEFRGNKFKK